MAQQGHGSYEQPRSDLADKTLNKVEGLEVHDGIPKMFFKQTWWKRFRKGLGTKVQDGYAMTVVLDEFDMGGTAWNAANAAALPLTADHRMR